MSGQRLTPDAHLVSTAQPETPEWFAARRAGITATDLPLILGVSPYGTALDVWARKTTPADDDLDGNEAMRWGHLLEDVIAREGARRDGISVRRLGVVANTSEPWKRASLDRLASGCTPGERCGVEVKNRSAYVAARWREEVPDDVLAQVVWQLHVTGLDHMHVYALLGGSKLDQHVVRRRDVSDIEKLCADAATALWGHVQAGSRPYIDPTPALIDSLNRLFTTREGSVVVADLTARDDYWQAAADERDAVGRKKTAQASLMQALGDATEAVDDTGRRLWSVTTTTRRTVDLDAAAADTEAWPHVQRHLRTSSSPKFNPPRKATT